MAFGSGGGGRQPIGAMWMLLALILAAFLGGALGLVWQGASFFDDEAEEEVVTRETPRVE